MATSARLLEPSPHCTLCLTIEAGKVEEVRKQIHLDRDQCLCEMKFPVYRMIKLYQHVLRQARADSMPKSEVWRSPEVHKSNTRSLILQTIAQLLAGGAAVNYTTGIETPLMAALSTCDEDLLWTLLDFKADVNLCDGLEDINALGLAILLNEVSLVDMLLKHGGKVNAPCCGNLVPIQLAMNKNTAVSGLLIQHGADAHLLRTALLSSSDHKFTGQPPLLVAVMQRNLHLGRLLLEHGEDVNQTFHDSMESPIHAAVRNMHLDMIEVLVAFGADLNKPNFEGHTPLGLSLLLSEDEHHPPGSATEVAKVLVRCGASPNHPTRISFFQRAYSPLHIACFKGNYEFVRFLVEEVCENAGFPQVENHVAESSHISLKDRDSTAQRNAAAAAADSGATNFQGRCFKLLPRTDRYRGSTTSQSASSAQEASRSSTTVDTSHPHHSSPGDSSGLEVARDSESSADHDNSALSSHPDSGASSRSDAVHSHSSAGSGNTALSSGTNNNTSASSVPSAGDARSGADTSLGASSLGISRLNGAGNAGQHDSRPGLQDGAGVQARVVVSLMGSSVPLWPLHQRGDAGDQYHVRSEVASDPATQPDAVTVRSGEDDNSTNISLPRREGEGEGEIASFADPRPVTMPLQVTAEQDQPCGRTDLELSSREEGGLAEAAPAADAEEDASEKSYAPDHKSHHTRLDYGVPSARFEKLCASSHLGRYTKYRYTYRLGQASDCSTLPTGSSRSQTAVRRRSSVSSLLETTAASEGGESRGNRRRHSLPTSSVSSGNAELRNGEVYAHIDMPPSVQARFRGEPVAPAHLHPYSTADEMGLRILNPPTTAWDPAVSVNLTSQAPPLSLPSSAAALSAAAATVTVGSAAFAQSTADGGAAVDPGSGSGVRSDGSLSSGPAPTVEEPVFQVEFGSPGYSYEVPASSKHQEPIQNQGARPKQGAELKPANKEEGEQEGQQKKLTDEEEGQSPNVVHFLNKAGGDGCTALFMAVYDGNARLVDYLLEHGARPHFTSHHGNFFHAAVLSQNVYLIRRALEMGCDINEQNVFGNSPLTLVSRLDCPEACDLLVTNGANMNARDRFGETPLLASVYFGCEMNARILIQNGANMDFMDDNRTSAIYWAMFNNRQLTLKLLLMAGARFAPLTLNQYPRNIRVMHNPPLLAFIRHYLNQPRTLLDLATVRVRQHLAELRGGNTILPSVDALPIPNRMKAVLCLHHFVAAIDDNDSLSSPDGSPELTMHST